MKSLQKVGRTTDETENFTGKAARKREDTRDPLKNYNKLSFKQFTAATPNINWSGFMDR